MASNSKKRRRVLGVSCILAALIIASSSFAWFTSKDEVTNRLSASGDYGVRIVESFAPPANWVPGQAVNKDVYAVNTGDVDAYVKETVSSVLTIVKEEEADIDTPDADCIELSAGERYAIEAGAFLAYAPAASTYVDENGKVISGRKAIAMNPDFDDEKGYTSAAATDFQPDAAGLYVFRRTIGVNDDLKDEKQLEEYTYDGYWYVPGEPAKDAIPNDPNTAEDESVDAQDAVPAKFYKISNLTVVPEKATFAGDRDDRDGILASADAGFWKEVTKTVVPELTYDAANNRLVAIYDTHTTDSHTNLTSLAKDYENKAVAYEDALEEYQAALRDQMGPNYDSAAGTDKALANANATLQSELAALFTKQKEMDAAKKAYDDAVIEKDKLYDAYKAAEKAKDDAVTAAGSAADDLAAAEAVLGDPSNTAAGTAYGDEYVAKTDRDSKLGARDVAQAALDATDKTARQAFITFLEGKTYTSGTSTKNYLNNTNDDIASDVTYQVLHDANFTNTAMGDDAFRYYTKLLELMYAQEELDDAQAAYESAIADRVEAENAVAIAQAAADAADAARGDTAANVDDAIYDPTTTPPTNDNAYGRYLYAKKQYEDKMVDLYGHAEGSTAESTGDTTGVANKYTTDSLYGEYKAKEAARDDQQAVVNGAQVAYNAALADSDVAAGNVTAAANNVAVTKQAMDDAKTAYDNAKDRHDSKIKININLADVTTTGGVADKWQLLPESLEDMYKNDTTEDYATTVPAPAVDNIKDTASFYYTSVLGGGQTTSKLIDSVELDSSVTKEMFKYFDFDLNIALNSVQVNVDENGNYTAETAQTELGKYAILSEPANADSTITWSDTSTLAPSSKPTSYVGKDASDNKYTITKLNVPKTIAYEDYAYELVDGSGNKYYANDKTGEFKKYDAANDKLLDAGSITITGTPVQRTGFNVGGDPVTVATYDTDGDLLDSGYKYKVVVDNGLASILGKTAGTYVSKTETGTYSRTTDANTLDSTPVTFDVVADN